MKTNFLLAFALGALLAGSAQAQVSATETQALSKQINQLMRNPSKPKQEVRLTLGGCHAEQLIRDRDADMQMSGPLAVSYGSGKSGWAVKMDNGIFELKMDFDWADVTDLSYRSAVDDDEQKHYQIKITKRKKGSTSSTSVDLPL
jgi:opacity protein-like surface antigen